MKISYNWLKNYFEADINPNDIAEILTNTGLEVEGFEQIESIKGGLEGLIIGKVLTKNQHPNADKLNLTTVNIGQKEPLNIVCGAPNVAEGQKVVVAPIGTTLYSNNESFKIKKAKIRGELSEGMICAEDEIGLGNNHDGIMVVDKNVEVGTLAKDFFKLENDFVYEIGLTPNRSDATGHYGVARDLVAALNLKSKAKLIKPNVSNFRIDNTNLTIDVEVLNNDLCPRYTGLTLTNIQVKESPDWLKNRLKSIGLTPINNIVDVSNFVLHETGQPLHAFDTNKITGNKIIVKTVADQTKFTTLDEVERKLSDNDLMICNEQEPMCIAGVFGGKNSGVNHQTTSIFLESAYFNPVTIRKSAKLHGLNTDASFRFERGADPNITIFALKRAANLIKEVAGAEISSEIIDIYPKKIKNFEINFSYANCNKLIGQKIDKELIKKILNLLEIEIIDENEKGLTLSVPPFKADVQREIDVIEEILRIYGYNNIQLPKKLQSSLSYRQKPDKEKITTIISDLLVANGFNELISNSLTKADYYKKTNNTLIELINPLSNDLSVLRQTLLFNGLEIITYNQNRKQANLKVFEFGKTYLQKEDKFKETSKLSLFLTGEFNAESWSTAKTMINFYHLKGVVDAIFNRFGLNKLNVKTAEANVHFLQYGLKISINNNEICQLGLVNPTFNTKFNIANEVFYCEINYDYFVKMAALNKIKYKEIAKFPTVRRDLALLLDKRIDYKKIKEIALQQEKNLLKKINLFDVYEGKNLEKGKKSYAVSFIFSDNKKTLTDQQIDKIMDKLIASLTLKLGAQLR